MEKKAGKFFAGIFLLSGIIFGSDASIVFRLYDIDHKPIKQVMCQAPFILQVELKNLDEYTDSVVTRYIAGMENFKTSRSMTSHNIVIDNGKKITKNMCDFILRADKKGNFSVGPLILTDKNGRSIKSNRLVIPVADEIISSESHDKEKYFLKVFVDKKTAYIGEKIQLHIQFYDRLLVDNLHLKFPDFPNMYLVKNQKNSKKSTIEIEGQEYSLTEWIFDVYAKEPGVCILQGITAAFLAPEFANKFTFGGAFDFFRSLYKTEQYLGAHPIKIDILPLPYDKNYPAVHAVGQFSKFEISLHQHTTSVGQGVTLTADLFGDANFEIMDKIPLLLPKNFNYYDANMITIDEHRSHKHEEFIVQASQEGQYQIQPQTLIYFDPVAVSYKILQSNSLDLEIIPATDARNDQHVSDLNLYDVHQDDVSELSKFTIITQSSVEKKIDMSLSLHLFLILLLCLLLVWVVLVMQRYRLHEYILNYQPIVTYKVFLQAFMQCKRAEKYKNVAMLYDLFNKLFAHLIHRNVGQLHDIDIVNYLRDKNFSMKEIESWKSFYHKILQSSFSLHRTKEDQDIFHQAFFWIKILKGKA